MGVASVKLVRLGGFVGLIVGGVACVGGYSDGG